MQQSTPSPVEELTSSGNADSPESNSTNVEGAAGNGGGAEAASTGSGSGQDGESPESVEAAVEELDLDVVGTLLEQVERYATSFIQSLPNLIAALVILGLTFVVAMVGRAVIKNTMQRAKVRRALISLTRTLATVVVWVVGLLVAMAVLFPSVDPASVLTAMGIGGIAIGFAFKDIFENFMAGAMIMLRKPMRIGDFIECEGVEGEVEDILIRDTYIRRNDGQLVILPNSMLYKNAVYVRTDRPQRRFELIAGVAYDTDVDEARDIIRNAVESVDIVDSDRGIDVFACEFNESSIDFRVRWWTESSPRDGHETTDRVIASIKQALDEAGIEIPFPYRTLTFGEALQIERLENAEEKTSGRNIDKDEGS